MSTTDPTGEGGGGGGDTTTASINIEQNVSLSTPISDTEVPMSASTQPPQQHPPPSPLSGCYLLAVLPEPHTAQHKDLVLNRLAKGFLSWDKDSCHVDLEKELLALVTQAPEGEEARNGERLIQYATENLVTEVLIHPQTNTLLQCIRNLLASFTKHRHIIHAGYTFDGNGSWILQDGTFSLADFLDAFSEHEVQRVLRAYENSVTVDIHCAGVSNWTTSRLSKEACCRYCRVRVNPDDVLTAGVPAITSFTNYIGQYLVPQTLDQLMEPSDVVGNIRFSHPTLYVFPGGQGDAALFGINGFNMLVDGGFARKACFWDFTRHLDRLDAVLVTRINNSNIGGMFSVLRKKKEMHVYPQIGHFFCNLVERRQSNSPDGDKDIDPLILSLTDIGQEMVLNLRQINLRAHPCYRDPDPINLYHKVGHGTLDMYVLSPSKDSREVRDFLAKWHASDSKLFAGFHKKDSNNLTFPIQNLISICALLVWQPANPEDTITRILFPGSTPQHKIFEGFERLKHLDFLKHPVCSAKTLSPSASLVTLRDKPAKQKFSLIEKETKKVSELKKDKREPSEPKSIKSTDESVPKAIPPSPQTIISTSKTKVEVKTKKVAENKKIQNEIKENKKLEKELKEAKKELKKESKKEPAKVEKMEKSEKREANIKKTDLIKSVPEKTAPSKELKEPKEPKDPKAKPEKKKEVKTVVKIMKGEATLKPKTSEKKAKVSGIEKKDAVKSSPTTPKKILNGTATKVEISKTVPKAKPVTKAVSSLPAKSAKEANNRKVVEQKKIEKSAAKDTVVPTVTMPAKPKPIDKKPITRRAKPISPNKARMPGSPAKSTRSTPTTSVKSEKDGVIRKVKGDKGTTDLSTVSTPSGVELEVIKPVDKSLIEQYEDISLDSIESKVLADLKEEREVVEEIEAVLQKAERTEETRKQDRFEGDDDITAEATDKKEEDMTEEDITAEIEDAPKKESFRKESQELTEEDEYLIVEKEEMYTEDSAQSGEGEQKHILDEAESEKAKVLKDSEIMKEKGEKEESEKKQKDESLEKQKAEKVTIEKGLTDLSPENKQQLQEEVKEIIASATEIVQKVEEKDDSGKKDSDDITKEQSSLSPDKLDSSEKKTTDTDIKQNIDQKEQIPEKLEESQERISTIESGATTTAPTLPEDERIPLDEIKEDIDEKHVIEKVKEKDIPVKMTDEVVAETVLPAVQPDVKVFDIRQTMHGLQRDIVKTPDEVADLPVHEEVDPKFYRMEDFEKGKEEKPSPTPQEMKDLPTPSKEQKGVFSFFGKVADKFEKGIDKLTKKSKKEGEKDSDEKSSSKPTSPKDTKFSGKTLLEETDMEKMFPKVGKSIDKPDVFEEVKPTIGDVKIAAIRETAAFIQEEIRDTTKQNISDIEQNRFSTDKFGAIKKVEFGAEEEYVVKDISPIVASPTKLIDEKEMSKENDALKDEDTEEDAEEVKALLEEASKKFKTVKDSLRDSLESLDEKIKEEEMIGLQHEVSPVSKDAVKDTLEGVAEKLEEIKPHTGSDIKESEKVKFDIPTDEEFEKEYEEYEGPFRDMKEAVKDVGEVLAGTAGISIDEKPKDVVEIVKKVAEVLKEDDFLSDKALFDDTIKKEEISSTQIERKSLIPDEKESSEKITKFEEEKTRYSHEDTVRKISITEQFPSEKVEESIEQVDKSSVSYAKPNAIEIKEEPCMKVINEKDIVMSPVKTDTAKDRMDARKISEEMLKHDQHIYVSKKSAEDDKSRVDVMQAGIESICVKKVAERPSFEERLSEDEIEEPVISFEQKISPGKAELVIVTPDSTPTSPKFSTERMYDQQSGFDLRETSKLSTDINKELEVIPELIAKSTVEVPSAVAEVREPIMSQEQIEIEQFIVNEYIIKGDSINIQKLEEICNKKQMSKRIIIEIVKEIIIKRNMPRNVVLSVTEEELSRIIKEETISEAEKNKSIVPDLTEEKVSNVHKHRVAEKVLPVTLDEEDVDKEKLIDGFVSIPRNIPDEKIDVTKKSDHEKDDFEAVEQEYKVRGISITSPDKAVEVKEREDIDETVEDTTSEVIEADEKFVQETKERLEKEEPRVDVTGDIKTTDAKKKSAEPKALELSESADTIEKYLDEAKEKPDDTLSKRMIAESTSAVPEKVEKSFIEKVDAQQFKDQSPDKKLLIDEFSVSDAKSESLKVIDEKVVIDETKESEFVIQEKQEEVEESKITVKDIKSKPTIPIKDEILENVEIKPEAKDIISLTDKSKVEQNKSVEIKEISIIKEESSMREISKSSLLDESSNIDDDSGIVKRMLVTASSEDGREETEICPTGSITFTKVTTPNVSPKDTTITSILDKDSKLCDKDSLHSSVNILEKDQSKLFEEKQEKPQTFESRLLEEERQSKIESIDREISKEHEVKEQSSSISSKKHEEKEILIVTTEKSEQDKRNINLESERDGEKGPIDEARSPSVISDKSDEKKEDDRSKSPSIVADKPDLQDVRECYLGKTKSPIFDRPESPKVIDKTEVPQDKDRSLNVSSDKSDNKEISDHSISSVICVEKIDLQVMKELIEDKKEELGKSISSSMISDKSEEVKSTIDSKSSSVAGDIADLKDVLEQSISPSTDKIEQLVDRSKSPSIINDKLDEKDDKVSDKNEDIVDKSSNLIGIQRPDKKDSILDESAIKKLEPEKVDTDRLNTSSITSEDDKIRSLSVISDKTEPKSSPDMSKSPSLLDDKFDQKDRSRSSSVASEKFDDIKVSSIDIERERSVSPSLKVGQIQKGESSGISSPVDKISKDGSCSHSGVDSAEKSPASRSRTASLYDDKLEKTSLQEEKDSFEHVHMAKSFDEKDEHKSSPKEKSPITSPEMIQKELQKIREKRFADFEETDITQSTKIEKSDNEEEGIVKLTAEKKMAIEKYILEEFITRKRKINLLVIEELVMIYSVPQFIVMEIIEDIICRQNMRRDSLLDFIDDELASFQHEQEALTPQKETEIEKYIMEEFIEKKKKITPEMLEEIIILKTVPRHILITIIEEIIVKRQVPRNTVIEGDLKEHRDKCSEIVEEDQKSVKSSTVDLKKVNVAQEYSQSHEKPSDFDSDQYDRDTKVPSASPSCSPELIASDKSTQDSPARSDPHTDEEILISEEKRLEIERLLEEEYIKKGRKITEIILEEIIIKTSLPKYIILEIIEEIISKRKISRESVIDMEIYQEEDYHKEMYHFDKTVDTDHENGKKSTVDYGTDMYSGSNERIMEKSITDYPMDYESQFHKAFVSGITEIRTTHITTLSGKSTPEFTTGDGTCEFSAEASGSSEKIHSTLSEHPLPTTHIEKTDFEDLKNIQSTHTEMILKDSKIAESHITEEDLKQHDDDINITNIIKSEFIDENERKESVQISEKQHVSQMEKEITVAKEAKQSSIEQEESQGAIKIIKREIAEHEKPEETAMMKIFSDSDKSTPDFKREDKFVLTGKDHLEYERDKFESSISPLIRDLISDDRSYSGRSSPDISLPKDIVFSGSTGRSTPDMSMSPLIRDGATIQPYLSGRSTPDRKSEGRSSTATPEGFRSGEMIRTTITTTKTLSEEGEIVTTTREVTETTNEKGETVVVAEKTDIKIDERLPSKEAAESALSSITGDIRSLEEQRSDSRGSDDIIKEEKHTYSDEELASSSLSSTSRTEYSPQPTRHKKDEHKQIEFSAAAMSSSFYGELPVVPSEISAMKVFQEETGIQETSEPISIHSRFTVEKEFAGGYAEKSDAKKYVDEADLDFDKALMEHKEMNGTSGAFSSDISPRYTNGSFPHELTEEHTIDQPSSSLRGDDNRDDSKGDSKKDPLSGWGTPLGLPSPEPPRKFNLKNPVQSSYSNDFELNSDVIKDWGEPLRLPSPTPVTNEVSNKGVPSTPKKERKQTKKVQSENIKNKKRSESPNKNEKKIKDSKNKIQPIYMDLAYVPHHGNSYYTSFEFFKRVRARYYVFSGTEPSREVYDALLEAKKTWEDKDLEVTMIPTYDTDTLGYWVADNEEALAANHIDLSPSASRCTINLQDHETSCSAYRLEF